MKPHLDEIYASIVYSHQKLVKEMNNFNQLGLPSHKPIVVDNRISERKDSNRKYDYFLLFMILL